MVPHSPARCRLRRRRHALKDTGSYLTRPRTSRTRRAPATGGAPGRRISASQQVYEQLKRNIITCRIAPGTAVHEGQLADSMGVSKTPIREALGQLVQEGYVEVRPRQGYRVTDVTLADIHEVFAIRRMLEPAAAELAAEHATAEQLQELQELAQTRYIVGDSDTYEAFIAEDRSFHVRVAEASGNGRLAAALRGLLEETQRLFFLGLDLRDTADEQVREREALVEALLRGNHHVARDVAERQVESSRKRVMQALLGSVRPAVTRATQPARDASDPVASDPVASDPVT